MKIHFHDLQSQYQLYKEEIDTAIQTVMDSGQFIMGQEVFAFEQALAAYLACNHVIGCASGTDALLLALMAIDLQPGDEVITTPFTFIATAEVICLLGAKPVFVDIKPDSYHLDPAKLAEKITHQTKAIIPVSLYGQPADMDDINQMAHDHGVRWGHKIFVIEDAAQSLGATYHEKKSANLSDIACLSFFPSKPLGCYGDGGAVTAKEDSVAEKIRSLRVHGQTKRYHHQYIGFNCRLDTIQAAILQVKLKYFNDELKKRADIAAFYHQALARYDLILPTVQSDRSSVYAQYSIRVKQRGAVMDYLKTKNIPTAIHYPSPLHLQPCMKYLGYRVGDFPVAERVSQEIMSLPMSAFVTPLQQEYIVQALHEALSVELIESVS